MYARSARYRRPSTCQGTWRIAEGAVAAVIGERQGHTLRKEMGFELSKIPVRVLPEPECGSTRLMAHLKLLAQLSPCRRTLRTQRFRRPLPQLCRHRCHEPHRPTHHQRTRWTLMPRRPSLMMPHGSKRLFQVVIRSWQLREIVAMEQTAPVVAAHFVERRRPRCHCLILFCREHLLNQLSIPLFHRCCVRPALIREHLGRSLQPVLGCSKWRPQRCRGKQPSSHHTLKLDQLGWQSLFFSTRASEATIALRRSYIRSPGNSRGGLPSSDRALRSARQ